MAKVRFELNIDEIIEGPICRGSDNEVFKTPDATNKSFLFVDKMTGMKQAAYCNRAATEEEKYADVKFFPIPDSAVIIDEDVHPDKKYDDLMSHIQNCCDKVCELVRRISENHYEKIDNEAATIRAMIGNFSSGEGISEKTLLEALKIVTRQTE